MFFTGLLIKDISLKDTTMIGSFVFERLAAKAAKALVKQGKHNGPALSALSHLIDSPDLHVILLGTGTPIIVEGRSGPCTAVVGGGKFYLVDVGPGTYRQISLLGLPIGRLTAVRLTHYHSDHIGDLGEVMTFSWIAGRTSPLPVYGPEGVMLVVGGFSQAYKLDGGYRTEHHKPLLSPSNHGFSPITIKAGKIFLGFITIEAFEVDHLPVTPAFGFRFSMSGRTSHLGAGRIACVRRLRRSRLGARSDLLRLHASCQSHHGRPRTRIPS